MTVFDTSVDAAPIEEGNLNPILPEERFILELIGFERSDPDQYRKNGGFRLTFAVFNMDGSRFEFKDEPYELWRTIDKDRNGQPVFNIGTQANDWASALIGRKLGKEDKFSVSELRNKRMSAMVVWRKKKPPAQGMTFDLASLRHVPVGAPAPTVAAPPLSGQVSADPSDEDIDRASVVADIQKAIKSLKKLDATEGAQAQQAFLDSDDDADAEALRVLLGSIQKAIAAAMDR